MLHCNASNTGCAYCTKKLLKIQGLRDRAREREVTISFKRVLPSLVSLISPAPPTSLQNKNQRENQRERERESERVREERERERHFDGAFGAEVGLEDILQAFGGVDVHVKCCRFVQHLRVWIQPY